MPNNGLLEIQCDKKGRNARFELFNNLGQLVFSEKIPEVVEKAEGRIYGILEEILKYGSFSDDFSILRISFQEET